MLDNLSAGGFYLRLARRVGQGEKLLVIAQIAQSLILLRGVVSRVEAQKDGTYGLAADIVRYRILSLIEIDK